MTDPEQVPFDPMTTTLEEPKATGIVSARDFKWRAIHLKPTLIFAPSVTRTERLKSYAKLAWGQDIWFGRFPLFKVFGVVWVVNETAQWVTR